MAVTQTFRETRGNLPLLYPPPFDGPDFIYKPLCSCSRSDETPDRTGRLGLGLGLRLELGFRRTRCLRLYL